MKNKIINLEELFYTFLVLIFMLLVSFILIKLYYIESSYLFTFFKLELFPFAFGILLGLHDFHKRRYLQKRFNWLKFIVQGIPALILGIPVVPLVVVFSNKMRLTFLPWWKMQISPDQSYFIVILANIWLGKILIDCFKNKDC